MPRASVALKQLRALGSPARARALLGYFKTGPGQYGAGDRFLGINVPQVRGLAREFATLPLDDIERLLDSSWHEARLLALVLMASRYAKSDTRTQEQIYRRYLRRTDRINNWDLVDTSAPQVVGAHLWRRSRAPLRRLAKSKSLWERRIAMVATQYFITRRDFDDAVAIAEMLLSDREDLIHKATGWMLREIGKRDEATLLRFLDRHAAAMPRTALRYSIERLSPARKKQYMSVPRKSVRR